MQTTKEIRVCMDIGSQQHRVGIGLSSGELLEEFDVAHTPSGIEDFFNKIERYEKDYQLPVSIAMEAYNGHARPIDQFVLEKGYRLYNVNNNKLAQFKKVFPGPAKSDAIDTRKMFDLFTLSDHLLLSKEVIQLVRPAPEVNNKLKRLTRRRRALVDEKIAIVNRMQSDIQACVPGLLGITGSADNQWFLYFLTCRDDIRQLARLRQTSILAIKGVGKHFSKEIIRWQQNAIFSDEIEWVGEMIVKDAKRLLQLQADVANLEKAISDLIPQSAIAKKIKTIPGFGLTSCAELAGEIGTFARFASESSLALYLGMAVLDNSSGNYQGTKNSKHVNKRSKSAMMTAVARHINNCDESKTYYDKKRSEGKRHNQAVRALGRHLVRVIWSMIKNDRDYKIQFKECKDEKNKD